MINSTERAKRFTHFIGIDVSKNELDFAVMNGKSLLFHEETKNNVAEIIQFITRLKTSLRFSIAKSLFCMEHTGIYCNHLLHCFKLLKANIVLENPLHIKNSLGLVRGKNDKSDAIRIAQYTLKNKDTLKLWTPKRTVLLELANLFAIRNRLIVLRAGLKTPLQEQTEFIKKNVCNQSMAMCQNSLAALKEDVVNVDLAMEQLINADERLKRLHYIITSVPGVGPVLAKQIIISTNEFLDIKDPKKFACYAGVVPFVRESGAYKGKAKISSMANKKVKTLLHISAICLLHAKGELRAYYDRKVAEGKPKMAVINAIRNKVVLRIFACVNQDRRFESHYVNTVKVA